MTHRSPWQGMVTIARLNWPLYVAAVVVLVGSCGILKWASRNDVRSGAALAIAGSLYFIVGSLAISHFVYDRSNLYRWTWLQRALPTGGCQRVIFCHAGFDETSTSLRQALRADHWLVLDHFDPRRMTEPSIGRARRLFPPVPGTLSCPFDEWPVESTSADVIFGLLAIHELRAEDERTAWFAEAARCLTLRGRVVLVEHTRDLANLLAFGPGFLHFHSPANWLRCWKRAGLQACDELRISPFVRVFVLRKT